jgi:hypothetical protein
MASLPATQALLAAFRLGHYGVQGFFADLTVEESVRRTGAAHRRGHDEYLAGRGPGGRYIPPEAIRALALPAAGQAPTPAHARQPQTSKFPDDDGFPGGEVTSLIAAYHAQIISLEDLACRFRMRSWPPARPACPPEMQDAAPAVDDPEPYIPESFDDVVLAYDLGKLSDHDYAELARAASAASPPTAGHPRPERGHQHGL